MAETPSTFRMQAGDSAPNFTLLAPAENEFYNLSQLAQGKPTLVIFACNHCPYVIHLAEAVGKLEREYRSQVSFIAISSNDVDNYPADSPEKMVTFQADYGWDFPYLYDKSQEVAKAYAAACTPDFFLFDAKLKLYWAGQFDETRPRGTAQGEPTGKDLCVAIEALLANKPSPQPWIAATGCNIKWKAGNEPAYF